MQGRPGQTGLGPGLIPRMRRSLLFSIASSPYPAAGLRRGAEPWPSRALRFRCSRRPWRVRRRAASHRAAGPRQDRNDPPRRFAERLRASTAHGLRHVFRHFPQLIGACTNAVVPFILGGHGLGLLSETQVSAGLPASDSSREHRRIAPAAEAKIAYPLFVGQISSPSIKGNNRWAENRSIEAREAGLDRRFADHQFQVWRPYQSSMSRLTRSFSIP